MKVAIVEEAYKLKSSALDCEVILVHEAYVIQRIKREMFKTDTGKLINANVTGLLRC